MRIHKNTTIDSENYIVMKNDIDSIVKNAIDKYHKSKKQQSDESSYIKEICERAAQLCKNAITHDFPYPDEATCGAHSYQNMFESLNSKYGRSNGQTGFEEKKKENLFPEMMFGMKPDEKNLVRDWYDLKIGEKYYMWAKRTCAKNRKIYILKYVISELNGDILNICVMKQCGGPKTNMFTLTESDCEHIGIEFESGLEVYPVNICWVKYKKHADVEEMNGANIKASPNEYIMPDYNKNYYTDYKNKYYCRDQIWEC